MRMPRPGTTATPVSLGRGGPSIIEVPKRSTANDRRTLSLLTLRSVRVMIEVVDEDRILVVRVDLAARQIGAQMDAAERNAK